ncbi:MAG TPA: ion transporter [Candidatus Acidoferrum sp.]|nr:ion transporter [Candidatus Acidoferrum sp.]
MQAAPSDAREKLSVFQLVLLVLSLVVIAALITDTVAPVGKEVSSIIQVLDITACVLFFVDFSIRFARAESKATFMKWGWIDLIACIPNVDVLRIGRMVRVLRIIRLLRGVRVGHRIISIVLQNKPKTALASVLLTTLLLVTFSAISILIAEDAPEANIKTAEDAIWWSVTTITTVGYGDKFPTSTEGRLIAMALMMAGVGLFGMLSGLIASFFLGNKDESSPELQETLLRLRAIEKKVNELDEFDRPALNRVETP